MFIKYFFLEGGGGEIKTIMADCKEGQTCILSDKVQYPFDVIFDSDLKFWVLRGHKTNFMWCLTILYGGLKPFIAAFKN